MKEVIFSSIILMGIMFNGCSGGGSDTQQGNASPDVSNDDSPKSELNLPEQKSGLSKFPPIPQIPVED